MPCSRVLRAKRALRGALHPAEGQKELAQLRTSNQSLQQQVTDAQAIATKTMAMQRQMRRGTASSDDVALAEQHSAVRRPPRGRGGGGGGGKGGPPPHRSHEQSLRSHAAGGWHAATPAPLAAQSPTWSDPAKTLGTDRPIGDCASGQPKAGRGPAGARSCFEAWRGQAGTPRVHHRRPRRKNPVLNAAMWVS